MTMNRYAPHVYVIPEDDANRQLADGFVLHHQVNHTRIQIVAPAGGWPRVLETFLDEYVPKLRVYPSAYVVMLIDFDDQIEQRRERFENEIPSDLRSRVFVVGPQQDPEALKKSLKMSYEQIGESLANDCDAETSENWEHAQLRHNETERRRMVEIIKPILF